MSVDVQEALRHTKLFQHLSPQEFSAVCGEIGVRHYPAGAVILSEGELGDQLHIIQSGAVRVFTYDAQGKEIVLARLEKGEYFGEQALLTALPLRRSASVRALTEVQTWVLSHAAFQRCLKADESLLALVKEQGVKNIIAKFTQQLDAAEAEQKDFLSLFSHKEDFEEREVIFRQKDPSLKTYILLSGAVEVRFYDEDLRLKSRSVITPGQFFGESGVLENTPRAGTAVALTSVQAAVIDPALLRDFCQRNPQFQARIVAQRQLYQIPAFGLVVQYQSSFQGQAAMNTFIYKENGETITASRLIHSHVLAIYYAGCDAQQRESFQDAEGHSREILLSDNRLVGVVSIGQWEDLDAVCRQVYQKTFLSQGDIEVFRCTGKIQTSISSKVRREGNLCDCMQVKQEKIQKLILEGITTVEAISKKTGAGTVCGGCQPRIVELLGGEAWTYVKISSVREHYAGVRSYQLQPLKGEALPFQAGQHIVIEANIEGLWVARSYTLTSLGGARDHYEITIKREERGLFSNWLFAHDREDPVLRVSAPQGTFIFDPEQPAPALCLMAGIGITPAIAFVRKWTESGRKRALHIDYSVRQLEEAAFRKELEDWPRQFPHLTVFLRATKQQGRIREEDVRTLILQLPEADIYLCGPKPYLKALSETLKKLGVTEGKIHSEEFTPAGEPFEIGEEHAKSS